MARGCLGVENVRLLPTYDKNGSLIDYYVKNIGSTGALYLDQTMKKASNIFFLATGLDLKRALTKISLHLLIIRAVDINQSFGCTHCNILNFEYECDRCSL